MPSDPTEEDLQLQEDLIESAKDLCGEIMRVMEVQRQ
jgi:hypothetical protein